MFDGLDLSKMGKMLEEVQKQAKHIQDEAEKKEYTAKSGGGLVKVSMSGNGEVVDISIDDSLMSDKESLQILLISAVNDVQKMVEDDKKMAASRLFSGVGGFGS
ncbi:MAG: YbaB/EbfC family nucleoid-associated protein [Sulfurospirillaceae bacterium]|nr:YbaB/EbfC family nucleoid-associated protein [Sulfurospirillaceae bacterium]MDD3462689.1 YbaB/EbfC family nucleoid-associated protein [Sulfurospirillaceae bacterium]